MGKEKETASLEDLIEKAGGCAVLDGGFATQLERHGAVINDPLWSALCLIKDPDLIKRVGPFLYAIFRSFMDFGCFCFTNFDNGVIIYFRVVYKRVLGPLGILGGWC